MNSEEIEFLMSLSDWHNNIRKILQGGEFLNCLTEDQKIDALLQAEIHGICSGFLKETCLSFSSQEDSSSSR